MKNKKENTFDIIIYALASNTSLRKIQDKLSPSSFSRKEKICVKYCLSTVQTTVSYTYTNGQSLISSFSVCVSFTERAM